MRKSGQIIPYWGMRSEPSLTRRNGENFFCDLIVVFGLVFLGGAKRVTGRAGRLISADHAFCFHLLTRISNEILRWRSSNVAVDQRSRLAERRRLYEWKIRWNVLIMIFPKYFSMVFILSPWTSKFCHIKVYFSSGTSWNMWQECTVRRRRTGRLWSVRSAARWGKVGYLAGFF